MFSLGHDGDITPLHGQPVGQAEDRDGGAIGPAGVQLENQKINILEFPVLYHMNTEMPTVSTKYNP